LISVPGVGERLSGASWKLLYKTIARDLDLSEKAARIRCSSEKIRSDDGKFRCSIR
jgi:hypothetical protein